MDRIEAAARRYCELMGVDPDEVRTWVGGLDSLTLPQWEWAVPKVRAAVEADAIQQALKETEGP